jgi:hypothetical protein
MGLSLSLLAVFLLFCLMMAGVLAFCLRERGRSQTIDHSAKPRGEAATIVQTDGQTARQAARVSLHSPAAGHADEDADLRVALTVFGAIFLGALLAVVTGYLVFFRDWTG